MNGRPPRTVRFLAAVLIAAYPAQFRRRFAHEMREHIAERWTDPHLSRIRKVSLLVDLAVGAARERWTFAARGASNHANAEQESWMNGWAQDFTDAARRTVRAPFFTATAVSIAALGIGVNIAVFTLANAFLLRPAPYGDADRVVDIYQDSDDGSPSSTSFPAYRDIAARTDLFTDVAATMDWSFPWEGDGEATEANIEIVTSSYFRTLGLELTLGRDFEVEHDAPGAGRFGIVSYHTWRRAFASDPGILGQTIRMNGRPVTIIGVGPREYAGYEDPLITDFYLSISSTELGGDFMVANLDRRQDHWYQVQARLAPGVTVEQAQVGMNALANRLAEEFPALNRGRDITVFGPGEVRIHPESDANLVPVAAALLTVAGLVLLLACSNLANLFLARGIGRRPEVALRRAFGADRWAIARIFVIESMILAVLGGAVGLALSRWLLSFTPIIPVFDGPLDVSLDATVVSFAVGLVVVTSGLFGLAPIVETGRVELADTLRENRKGASASRRTRTLRGALVCVQVAVSMVLLVGATLMVRSLSMIRGVDVGFETDQIAYLRTDFTPARIPNETGMALMADLVERLEASPGVESAALATRLPVQGFGSTTTVVENYTPPSGSGSVELPFAYVSETYFETIGIPVVRGRALTELDGPGSESVLMVNETAAERFWGGLDPLTGRVRPEASPDAWRRVVGVAGDSKVSALGEPPTPILYYPLARALPSSVYLVVRTERDPETLLPLLRQELAAIGPSLPVSALGTFDAYLGSTLSMPRIGATIAGAFSLVALALASLGIYAVVSFTVARRTSEMGIRAALGADRTRLIRSVAGQTLTLSGVGIALGLGAMWLAAPLAENVLYGLSGFDPTSVVLATSLLVTVAGVAAYIPARRAATTDPVRALRSE